jgi:hypothetical protein
MAHRNMLSIRASMAAVCAQLARPKCRDEGACTLETAVAISCIRSDELVGIATKLDAGFSDQVQQSEFVVCNASQQAMRSCEYKSCFALPPGTPKMVSMPNCFSRVKR